MNWNNNDFKYILKRVIVYFIIASILFLGGQRCARAATISVYNNVVSQNMPTGQKTGELMFSNGIFANAGEGYVNFTLSTSTGYLPNWSLSQVKLEVGTSSTNIISQYVCDMGTYTQYTDSTVESIYYSVKCPVNVPMGQKIFKVTYSRLIANAILGVNFGDIFTFVGSSAVSSDIMNGTNQQIQNQISNDNTNTQQILNNIGYYSTQEINSINYSSQTAHADAVAISTDINNLTDTINADYTYNSDFDNLFNFESLFQADDDFIRRILIFPFTVLGLIANTASLDSCVQYDFGEIFGYHLIFPCITWKNYVGTGIYLTIDTIFGICLLFGLIRYIIGLFDYIFSIGLKGTGVALSITTEAFK